MVRMRLFPLWSFSGGSSAPAKVPAVPSSPASQFWALTARSRCRAFLPRSSRLPFLPRRSRRYGLLAPVNPHPILLISHLLGGLFPGITLLLSNFYKRHAMQLRFAMMFSVTSLAGAFSGLLAYGIRNLDGKHGIAGWQWIFIVVRRLPCVGSLCLLIT